MSVETLLTTSSEAEFIISFKQPIASQYLFSYTIIASDESENFQGKSLNQWGKGVLIAYSHIIT